MQTGINLQLAIVLTEIANISSLQGAHNAEPPLQNWYCAPEPPKYLEARSYYDGSDCVTKLLLQCTPRCKQFKGITNSRSGER